MIGSRRRAWLACLVISSLPSGLGALAAPNPCEQAAAEAERAAALPPGLLLAIGHVESGRWDGAQGRAAPWPWTLNVEGEARWFQSRDDAVRALDALLASGTRNVDAGCFQVNLRYHPDAFADAAQALDPAANGAYAARFLTALHDRLGDWNAAVAAYHSGDAMRGEAYLQRVQARLVAAPVVVDMGVRVWTPGAGGDPHVVALPQPPGRSVALPRVIGPAD